MNGSRTRATSSAGRGGTVTLLFRPRPRPGNGAFGRFRTPPTGSGDFLARECTGPGTGVAGTITLDTGTYHCRRVVRVTDTEPLYIAGHDC
ncbi:hypothetical protein [Microbispora sp. NPDC049633]|uniref:hypothetical protein n=1 Tax=Microbispora sp. NPDC049633 TaxID=3154355 RepID=UPI003426878C